MDASPEGYRTNIDICLADPYLTKIFSESRIDIPSTWQMPQGGIDTGEELRAAAVRELREETGVTSVEIIAEGYWMARRKVNMNNAGVDRKGKGVRKQRHAFSRDRNRASPAPIIKLYKSLVPAQRDAIIAMGHGSSLSIMCEQLPNSVIHWFAQCYQPGSRR